MALNVAAGARRLSTTLVVEWAEGELQGKTGQAEVALLSQDTRRPPRALRAYRLAAALRRLKPDIAVSMLSPAVSTVAGKCAGVPVAHWLQGVWSRRTGRGDGRVMQFVSRATLRVIARHSVAIFGPAPGILEECLSIGLNRSKLFLVPNGVNLPPLADSATAEVRAMRRVVTIARLDAPKRHDLVLDAFASIRAEGPLELVIAGSGPHEERLRQQAQRLGILDAVTFTGFVNDPARLLSVGDVFVLATDHDACPNVLVEALARGVPVVASDVPYGPGFILADRPLTALVEPNSASALAAGLRSALAWDPSPADRLQARGRAEDFELQRVVERFEDVVSNLVTGERTPSGWSLDVWP